MKVPKLKNIRVRSRYDGMGTIEQIYTASNKSMKAVSYTHLTLPTNSLV